MKTFLLDLWNDLLEKRLWPVAVALLAGLVAVPVVLSKPAEEPSAPAPAATAPRGAPDPEDLKGLASVKLEQGGAGSGSTLDTFDPSDPFSPPADIVKRSEDEDGAGVSITQGGVGDLVAPGGEVSAGSGGGADTVVPDTGDTDTGDTGDTDDGDDGTTTTQFAYVIDVTFTANGRTRRIKGMEKLDMLPSQAAPLLLFVGVSANAGNAVFLVDSTLQAAGEGTCKPSASECAFLHLGPGSEHEFTNEENDSYTLRIDQIRKVKVDSLTSSSSRTRKANAAIGSPSSPRRFVPPLLADLVSVSSGPGAGSNDNPDRR